MPHATTTTAPCPQAWASWRAKRRQLGRTTSTPTGSLRVGILLYLKFFTRSSVSTFTFPLSRCPTRFPECTVSQTIDSYSTGWDGYCQTDDTTACLDVPASDSDADALKCAVPKTGYYIDATGEAKRNVKSKIPPTTTPISRHDANRNRLSSPSLFQPRLPVNTLTPTEIFKVRAGSAGAHPPPPDHPPASALLTLMLTTKLKS